MAEHSDYRKFDGVLRMVLHASERQANQIKKLLKREHKAGTIFYGVHETDSSLMTCFVDGLNDGEHIHFIDGNNGGYALAAKGMKAQMKDA